MKVDKKTLKYFFILFALGFGSSLMTFRRGSSMSAAQMIGCAVAIGLMMIPLSIFLAVFFSWLMGIASPGAESDKSHDKGQK